MKHKGKIYLVVTFSSPIGENKLTTNLMKHKEKNVITSYMEEKCHNKANKIYKSIINIDAIIPN